MKNKILAYFIHKISQYLMLIPLTSDIRFAINQSIDIK